MHVLTLQRAIGSVAVTDPAIAAVCDNVLPLCSKSTYFLSPLSDGVVKKVPISPAIWGQAHLAARWQRVWPTVIGCIYW